MAQSISTADFGSRARRVLDAVAPLTGTAAPAANADFIGQIFVDTTANKVYSSVSTDAETPSDDWRELTRAVLTGTAAPAANAEFVGQIFVDTTNVKIYISVSTDAETPANDWKELTQVA